MKNFCRQTVLFLGLILFTGTTAFAHCEIPCGIYDDEMRIKMLAEHVTTIEKSMAQIQELSLNQREPDRARIPHINLKTKGKKMRPWISQRTLDCLKSLLCNNTSKIMALTIKKNFTEKILFKERHRSPSSLPNGPLSAAPGTDPVSQ